MESPEDKIEKLQKALDYLWWDYHSRFHKDDANNAGHHACIEWPCLQIYLILK